ncbi:MAG: hypothetical protein AABX70_08305 [Nanoarchaeota archaeon]
MKKDRKEQEGLYELVTTLSKAIPNESEASIVIGLGVLSGLIDFSSTSKSTETLAFEQVKAVYRKLGEVIKLVSETEEGKFNIAYSTLNGVVETSLGPSSEKRARETSLEGQKIKCLRESVLLYPKISWTIEDHRRSYLDLLKRRGGALMRDVSERGSPHQKRSMLFADYRSIENNFVNGRIFYAGSEIP